VAVNASAVWRVRPSGSNTNGGGFDSAISGAGTDYSQQNAAQASGSNGTAAATTTFSDTTANAFTSQMVGNAIWIASGAGFTAGAYFVTAYVNAGQVTLDRSPGTGSAAIWKLGGGWATFVANTTSATYIKGGNIIYILGGASPSIASPDYAPTTFFTPAAVSAAAGPLRWLGDPNTPANNGFGGRPLIVGNGLIWFNQTGPNNFEDIYLSTSSATQSAHGMIDHANGLMTIKNVVFDQDGWDIGLSGGSSFAKPSRLVNVEIFSGRAKRTTNVNAAVTTDHFGGRIINCNIHDCIGPGIQDGLASGSTGAGLIHIENTIVAKNGGDGIKFNTFALYPKSVVGCTIDGNTGHGINFPDFSDLARATLMNNIISNHTGGSKYGINVGNGSAAANALFVGMIDYNVYYGNTNDLNNLSYGAHDTHGGSDPYTGQGTQDYSLNTANITTAMAFPSATFPQHKYTAIARSYIYPGAVQPILASGPAALTYANAFPNAAFQQHKASQTTTVQSYVYPGAVQPTTAAGGFFSRYYYDMRIQ
jgi:hypothetical protein